MAKTFIHKHLLLSTAVITALLVGGTVYGWQYMEHRNLVSNNKLLRAKVAEQDDVLGAGRKTIPKDRDAITRLVRADYQADPAHKTPPRIKVEKIVEAFALSTVTAGEDTYKVITKKVGAQWTIIIKSKNIPQYELTRFAVPAKLLEP